MARELVERNVVELVVTPRGLPGRPSKSLTERQVLDLLTLTKGHWTYAYIVVSMLVGVRTEEMRALTWDRIDLDAVPVTIAVCHRGGLDTAGTAALVRVAHVCGRDSHRRDCPARRPYRYDHD